MGDPNCGLVSPDAVAVLIVGNLLAINEQIYYQQGCGRIGPPRYMIMLPDDLSTSTSKCAKVTVHKKANQYPW